METFDIDSISGLRIRPSVGSSKFNSQKLTKIKRTVFSGVTVYNSIISQCLDLDIAIMLKMKCNNKKIQ